MRPLIPRWLAAALASVALVGAVTAVIALLEPGVPALGLGVLYLLAVVPVALVYGVVAAGAVSVASMVAFNFFFLPPRYTLDPGTLEQWEVLVALLVSSLVVSALAARSRREAGRSARLADEQAALRRVATLVARALPPEGWRIVSPRSTASSRSRARPTAARSSRPPSLSPTSQAPCRTGSPWR